MDGWKTILSFWEGRRSNFRGHILLFKTNGITEPVVKFQHCPYGKSGGRNWIDTATNLWTCIDPIIDCKEIVHELYSQLHQLHPPKTWMDTQNDGLEKLVPVEWVGHFWYIDMLDPIVSMYGIFGPIYHKNQPTCLYVNIPYMDPVGIRVHKLAYSDRFVWTEGCHVFSQSKSQLKSLNDNMIPTGAF